MAWRNENLTEPVVTLTDFGLALESAILGWWLLGLKTHRIQLRFWLGVFFASVFSASLLGGLVHGFFLEPGAMHSLLWKATLVSLVVTSLSLWMLGAHLDQRPLMLRWIPRLAWGLFLGLTMVAVFVSQNFVVAIASYLPATVFLLVVSITVWRRVGARPLLWIALGLFLTLFSSAIQQLKVSPHPVYFNHNALYHLIQAIALFLLYRGGVWMLISERPLFREAEV